MDIVELDAPACAAQLPELSRLLRACVEAGASIGFVTPLPEDEIQAFWCGIEAGVARRQRRLFIALQEQHVIGTVQLVLDMPANGRHRADIVKLMVAPDSRRLGLGRQLMRVAEQVAHEEGRRLLVLDTRSGDVAEPLYLSLGYQIAGRIPVYARSTEGVFDSTTIMYKPLTPAGSAC